MRYRQCRFWGKNCILCYLLVIHLVRLLYSVPREGVQAWYTWFHLYPCKHPYLLISCRPRNESVVLLKSWFSATKESVLFSTNAFGKLWIIYMYISYERIIYVPNLTWKQIPGGYLRWRQSIHSKKYPHLLRKRLKNRFPLHSRRKMQPTDTATLRYINLCRKTHNHLQDLWIQQL